MATCHHRCGHDGSCRGYDGNGAHVSRGDCSSGGVHMVWALLSHGGGDEYASPDVEQG
jgi:hypothetical protein